MVADGFDKQATVTVSSACRMSGETSAAERLLEVLSRLP